MKKRSLLNLLSANYTLRNRVMANNEYLRIAQGISGYLYQIQYEEDARRFVTLYLEHRAEVGAAREHAQAAYTVNYPQASMAAPLLADPAYGDLMRQFISLAQCMDTANTAMYLTYEATHAAIATSFTQLKVQFTPDATGISMTANQASALLLNMATRNIVSQLFIEHIRPHIGRQTSHEQIESLLPRQLMSDAILNLLSQFREQHVQSMSCSPEHFDQHFSAHLSPLCRTMLHHQASNHISMLNMDAVVNNIKTVAEAPAAIPAPLKLDDCYTSPKPHPAYCRAEEEEPYGLAAPKPSVK